MTLKETIETLRRMYEGFKKGEEDVLAVRDRVRIALEKAIKNEANEVAEELEDMLMDLELSIEDNKCKCHKSSSIC